MTQAIALATSRLWRERPKEMLLAGGLAFAAFVAAGTAYSTPDLAGLSTRNDPTKMAPPAPPPLLIKELPPEQALAINKQIPLIQGPNPAAPPFSLNKADAAARDRALECLASAIYYEAGSQDADGERAVAQVVLNRVRHPAFPASVCGVVYEGSTRPTGCQFTFTCDGSLMRQPDRAGWDRARTIAAAALNGFVYAPVGTATHYHADYVVPYWAETLSKNAVVGAHIFYRWAGGWGRPTAFTQAYSRSEPNAGALRSAAIMAEQRDRATRSITGEEAQAIAEIPGAEAIKLEPSMRGDKRVAIRFNLTARKASDAAKHEDYVEKVKASDNLRFALTGGEPQADEKPLGQPAAPAPASGGSAQ